MLVGYHLLPLIGAFLIVQDRLEPADAIVVMAGERPRVVYARRLIADGYAEWIILTTPAMRREAIALGLPPKRLMSVDKPELVSSTYDEVLAVRRVVQDHRWHSLIVVTSPYHTRRSHVIYEDIFRDTEVRVQIQPVANHWYQPDSWWKKPTGRENTLDEYIKLSLYLFGLH